MRQAPLNVILIGFMGCGKTTLGVRLSGLLGFDFVDTDNLIVKHAGKSIPDIFKESGEAGFRAIETEVLRGLMGRERMILATGGGIVTVPENHALLRQLGIIVYVTTSDALLWSRVRRGKDRPMVDTKNPKKTFMDLLEARRPNYESLADVTEDTRGLNPEDSAYGIAESIRVSFRERIG